MGETFNRTYTVTRGLEEYEVECEFEIESWGCAGSYSGPPESSYPAEGIEAYLASAFIVAPPWAKDRYPYGEVKFALTDAERWSLEEQFYADPPEPDYGPDPDDYRDARYDDERWS